jgi:hypothetical protein
MSEFKSLTITSQSLQEIKKSPAESLKNNQKRKEDTTP